VPPWLKESADKEQPRIFTTEIQSDRTAATPRKSVSMLVVPLCHNGDIIGALGIVSAGGRRHFGDSSLRFGRALADLASVALHRAEALDREQKARSEAESAVRTRDAVVSIVSHDLRNPLMAILGSAELLLEMITDDAQGTLRTQLEALKHAASTMDRLVRDLLDVTRLESGPLPVTRRPLNIVDVVREVAGMFQPAVRSRRVAVTYETPKDMPLVLGDRDRLGQALSNLIGNAVKFSPDGGTVHVTVDAQPTTVRVNVHDRGPGIPSDQVGRLFDRFWQASRADSRGLGLGLTIVKAIAEAHHGSVGVESTINKGSIFSITLPRGDAEAGPRSPARATPPSMEHRARAARERATNTALFFSAPLPDSEK
jgi:signal transduction histidine kinase